MAASPTVRLVAVDPLRATLLFTLSLPFSDGHPAHVDGWIVAPRPPISLN